MPLDTLANVKMSLLITGTTDDAVLGRLIDMADGFVAEYTGRAFAGGTFTELHPAGGSLVFVRNFPVTSVTSLKVDSARLFGAETAWAADRFVVHADRGVIESVCGPFLRPRGGRRDDWPAALQVVYATPTGAVPAGVKEAFCQLVGHWYRHAKTVADQNYQMLTTRIEGANQKDWSWGLASCAPLPPGILRLLDAYRVPPA